MKLLAIDGNSIMNRAYYGMKPLSTKDGIFTHAILGFLNIYQKLKGEICPAAFDLREPTFRHKKVESYKANRHGMDEELAMQMPYIKDILRLMGITVIEKAGYEADDVLGTLSCAGNAGDHVYILSGDRDILQLVNDNVTVLLHTTRELIAFTPDRFMQEYEGLRPLQLVELKGLMGDTSDNIPGVKGIGKKTATDLIKNFDSVENIYRSMDAGEFTGTKSVVTKLTEGKESAFESRWLAQIVKDVPGIEKNAESYAYKQPDSEELAKLLSRLEMYKLIEKFRLTLPKVQNIPIKQNTEKKEYSVTDKAPEGDMTFLLKDEPSGKVLYTLCGGKTYRTSSRKEILRILSLPCRKKTFDAKPVYRYCLSGGISLKNIVSDAYIASYILNTNDKQHELGNIAALHGTEQHTEMGEYADICVLDELCTILDDMIDKKNCGDLYRNIELPLTEVLASMEHEGVAVDPQGIKDFGEKLEGTIKELEERIFLEAGEKFNISSPKQLSAILFEKLGLPHGKKTKSGYSTDAEVLEDLSGRHPIIEDILLYRSYTKLTSTYVEGLLKQVEEDGRIHTVFKQCETRTGRISSTEPNLQNIPVRTELGREMRKFFVSPKGSKLVDADYSQIELRVLAHLSGDENMKKSFLSGTDIHTATASQVFGMPVSMVTPEMRRAAKAVNFGIVYGIGAFSLAKDINVSNKEAQKYIDNYLNNFSGVREFMSEAVEKARKLGYSETAFGRRRYIPELSSKKANIAQLGKRMAMNAPVQGTAADVIKIAMVRVYKRLKEELPEAKLVLQIHDELIIEASEKDAPAAEKILSEEMQNAAAFTVPLAVDVKSGNSWFETH